MLLPTVRNVIFAFLLLFLPWDLSASRFSVPETLDLPNSFSWYHWLFCVRNCWDYSISWENASGKGAKHQEWGRCLIFLQLKQQVAFLIQVFQLLPFVYPNPLVISLKLSVLMLLAFPPPETFGKIRGGQMLMSSIRLKAAGPRLSWETQPLQQCLTEAIAPRCEQQHLNLWYYYEEPKQRRLLHRSQDNS